MSYFDKHGLVFQLRHRETENGPLFRARLEVWRRHWASTPPDDILPIHPLQVVLNCVESWDNHKYMANPLEKTQHFSRDNMYGLYMLASLNPHSSFLKKLPIMKWNNRKGTDKNTIWWHPNGWAVFISLKSKPLSYVMFPLVALMVLYSFVDYWRNPKDTSGACLWLDMLPLLGQQNIFWRLIFKYIRKKKMLKVIELYDYYTSLGHVWDNPDHPFRQALHRERDARTNA